MLLNGPMKLAHILPFPTSAEHPGRDKMRPSLVVGVQIPFPSPFSIFRPPMCNALQPQTVAVHLYSQADATLNWATMPHHPFTPR